MNVKVGFKKVVERGQEIKANIDKKKLKKACFYFICVFSLLTVTSISKSYYTETTNAKKQLVQVFESWKDKDMKKVAKIAQTSPENFKTSTGFENNKELAKILDKHIYQSVDYEMNTMSADIAHMNVPNIKTKLVVTTYNNLEVIDTVIKQLIDDEFEVSKDYSHEEFIARNLDKIKKAVSKIEKNYQKIMIVDFDYEDGKYYIPFEKNKEFYNAISGNMIVFSEEIPVEKVPL